MTRNNYVAHYYLGISKERHGKLEEARSALCSCGLCGNFCRVNRFKGEKGKCNSGKEVMVSSYNLHFGEEPPISGYSGSGTIFFTNCSLSCVYCQNFPISQLGNGNVVTPRRLAQMMMELQKRGVHNINLVTPTHFIPQIVEAIFAKKLADRLPFLILESDALRKVIFSVPTHTLQESSRLFRAIHHLIEGLLRRGIPLILDATNLSERYRERLYNIADR